MSVGPGMHLKRVPSGPENLLEKAGIKPEQFDYFHEAIVHSERTRMMCPGTEDGVMAGINIGLPPIIQFGPEWMKNSDIVDSIVLGNKTVCLAITEPFAGSDVAAV